MKLYTRVELTKALKVSGRRIAEVLGREGAPAPRGRRGRTLLYDLAAVRGYVEQGRALDNNAATETLTDLRRAKLRAEIALLQSKVKAEDSRWVAKDEHERTILDMAAVTRSAFLSLPHGCAPRLAGMQAPDIYDHLEREVRDCLRAISDQVVKIEAPCSKCPMQKKRKK